MVTLVADTVNTPDGVAVDGSGNVFFVEPDANAVKEWIAATQTVSTLVSSGLDQPDGVAVDGSGNVYIADSGNNAIKEWNAATQTVSTLVASGLSNPTGVAVDGLGNVYIADTGDNAIGEWNAATQTVSSLVPPGLSSPTGVAVDAAGNVYIADSGNNAIKEWNAATQTVSTLVSAGVNGPLGVAVDGSGNVYIADSGDSVVEEWNAATQTLNTLPATALDKPSSVAVDASGNVYFTDRSSQELMELPRAFVPGGTVSEGAAAGSDALPPVLPTGELLTGVFAPTSDQGWLTIGSIASGVVNFSFTQDPGAARTAHIDLLGQQVAVNQAGDPLGTVSLLESAAAGSDSDIVTVAGSWTAAANASWLHTTASGSASGLATFSFDANLGPTRTGTLTIAGVTLTVTQVGDPYAAAYPLATLVSGTLSGPSGLALDASGNAYIADSGNNAIKEWNAATQTVSTLVSTGLSAPRGVAVDAVGNVYIADTGDNAIEEWNAATKTVSTLVSTGLNAPQGVAVDAAGNVYIADTGNNAIKEWHAATQTVSMLALSGLSAPQGVAVDLSGNVYIADTGNNAVEERNAATQTVSTLVATGLSTPQGLAVDASGNVYFSDSANTMIREWHPATQIVTTLLATGLTAPSGVAVNALGNVYYVDHGSQDLVELGRAFVPLTAVSVAAGAGSAALATVLPAGEPLTGAFAPTSNQSWLTIGSTAGGVVHFSFAANSGAPRTATINVLGRKITVTQTQQPAGSLGVFNDGYWYRDMNGDNKWTSADGPPVAFAPAGATPVVGDWDGSGKTELGYYLNGTWYLQTASGVEQFTFGFTGSNVFPVVGDWNGDGKTEVGVYCNGAWFRDVDGSHTWDAANQAALAYLGWDDGGTNTVIPVPAYWAGDGKTEIGVYCKGVWFLDSTGDGQWDGSHTYWGWNAALIPVPGNWNSSSTKDGLAVYYQGVWFRDVDGTHTWDAANQAAVAYFGWAVRSPWWASGPSRPVRGE